MRGNQEGLAEAERRGLFLFRTVAERSRAPGDGEHGEAVGIGAFLDPFPRGLQRLQREFFTFDEEIPLVGVFRDEGRLVLGDAYVQ